MQLTDGLKSERDLGDARVIDKGQTTLREARFTDADLQGIWALCRRSYKKYHTSTFIQFRELYRQLWLNNPARTSEHVFGWVVEGPHQEIGGFFGLIPISIKIGDREIIAGGGHAWVVSPAYRGYSVNLFRQLMLWGDQHFLVITGAAQVVASFTSRLKLMTKIPVKTFDQHLYWLIRPEVPVKWALNKSGWTGVAKMADHVPFAQVLTCLSRVGFAGHRSLHFQCPKLTVEPVHVFTDEFDQLWEDNRNDYGITSVRDRKSLAWRHFDVPSLIGKTYVFACRDGKQLQGYLALQVRTESAGFLSGHYVVTDVFYQRSRKDVLYNLMNHAFEFAKARGGSLFEVSGCGAELRAELSPQRPYIRKAGGWAYWYKAPTKELEDVCQREQWWPSASDGESNL